MSTVISAQPSKTRQRVAQICGVIAVVCTGLFLSVLALHLIVALAGQMHDAPVFLFIALMLTTVPVILCAILAVASVGFRRSRLAWASLAAYFGVPGLIGLILFIVDRLSKLT